MANTDIPIIIPAYEPDSKLISLLENLHAHDLDTIILVDDGSGEEYQAIFDEVKNQSLATVLVHEENKGKGRALKTAFSYILEQFPKSVLGSLTADSDGQHTAEDIHKIMDVLREKPKSLILGARDFSLSHVPLRSKMGNTITKTIFSFLSGTTVTDTQTGLRAIPRHFMEDLLHVKGERFEFEMNMLVESRNKAKIVEVPIETVYESKTNHKSHFHTVTDSIKVYKVLLSIFATFLFSSLSATVLDIGLFHFISNGLVHVYPTYYVILSTIFARMMSATYNYTVNYYFVFHSKASKQKSLSKYIALAIIEMSLSAIIVHSINLVLSGTPVTLIKIATDLCIFFMSYYVQRKFIF